MKRVLIIDHFSQAPEEKGNNRFIFLARMLVSSGYQVEIVTSDFSHILKKKRNISEKDLESLPYKYTLISEPPYKKNVCFKRIFSHFIFGRNLNKYLSLSTLKYDLIYMAIPSHNAALAGMKFCQKHKIKTIVDIQDLWPEAFKLVFNVPFVSNIIFYPLEILVDRIYTNTDALIAVSKTYIDRGLRSNSNQILQNEVVFLGTSLEYFDNFAQKTNLVKKPSEIWIIYTGTLGHSYDLKAIIRSLTLLKRKGYKDLILKVLGDGPQFEELSEYANSSNIKSDFLGRLDYGRMVEYLVASDIAVNPIVKNAAQSIINKHADYAAAGLPVVSSQNCEEYVNLLNKYKCGINCEPSNENQISDAIEKLILDPNLRNEMGRASRKMAEELFDRNVTYKKIIGIVNHLIS